MTLKNSVNARIARRCLHKPLLLLCLTVVTPLIGNTALATETIIVWDRTYDQASMLQVLQLALDKTANAGNYQLVRSINMEQGRVMRELNNSKLVDVSAFAPSIEREHAAIAIRIPVSKGLLGYRVCLVRAGETDKFKGITTADDWIKSDYLIGQGAHWPDTQILLANGFKVIESVRYKPLFHMLLKHRFDCFPRSINEVLTELKLPENSDLALENNLVFQYRLPTFFFVNKSKPDLANRIEKGLKLAIRDGSFDTLFYKHNKTALKTIDISQRHIIKLNNPYLSPETQSLNQQPELWLNPTN